MGQSGGGPLLIDFILGSVVGLLVAEGHCGLACVLGVVVPNGTIGMRILLFKICSLLGRVFSLPAPLLLAEQNTGLIVVETEAWVTKILPLDLLAWLPEALLASHPKVQVDLLVLGLGVFLGLSTKLLPEVFLPAGLSSILLK